MSYLVVTERRETSFGAYGPDLPGCAAVGETEEEALRGQGLAVPERRSHGELVGAGGE